MRTSSRRPQILPPRSTAAKLFFVGSTVGPLVDSLHNQCLLAYDIAPISIAASPNNVPLSASPLFCSSWVVPPLLGIAYIILGYILPRVIALITDRQDDIVEVQRIQEKELQNKAIWAVASTASIIKLSEILQTHDAIEWFGHRIMLDSNFDLFIMAASDAVQWALLDCTPVALLEAVIVAFGGPLAELPFVAHGFWHYIPQAADYFPLSDSFGHGGIPDNIATIILGEGYRDLALSSITGPCYFAVTMDAIALSRYIDRSSDTD